MIVLLTLYPTAFLFGFFVQTPLLVGRGMPFWLALFLANALITGLLGWYLVPWASRALDWWLNPTPATTTRVIWAGVGLIVALYGGARRVRPQFRREPRLKRRVRSESADYPPAVARRRSNRLTRMDIAPVSMLLGHAPIVITRKRRRVLSRHGGLGCETVPLTPSHTQRTVGVSADGSTQSGSESPPTRAEILR